jgi:hypothetical protein
LEYRNRPLLPAPLILLEHAFLLGKWLFGLCCAKVERAEVDSHAPGAEEETRRLVLFQELNTDKYVVEDGCGRAGVGSCDSLAAFILL